MQDIPASFTSGERWYVFYTLPNLESVAQGAIKRDTGLPVFIPFEKRTRKDVRGSQRHYETAVFSRYGFVRFDINKTQWRDIESCKAVVGIVKPNGVPQHVPDHAVNGLMVADKAGLFDRTKPPAVGMDVQIEEGPFAGLVGKVRRARAADRLDVLLDFLGKQISVSMRVTALKACG